MDEHEAAQLRDKLQTLVSEHRDLDDVINRLAQDPTIDQLQLSRMKKRKLQLKDLIARVRSRLIPDMEA
ncbi:YdcH family protein [Thiohalophilus sp.]|uniref:YdcH family protein n=1 Tax=Thiohalophilus sp. TaxID=3028392 RepID=UPI002ACE144A|nr:YdcH family protein [Thiohalophilus sp.]MDZ7804081.1 YdcH family protein [Thiohalophilus sp.]